MDVLVVGSDYEDRRGFMSGLCSALRRKDCSVTAATGALRDHRALCGAGIPSWCYVEDPDYRAIRHSVRTDSSALKQIESEYALGSLWDFVFTEHSYFGVPRERLLAKAVALFKWAERVLSSEQPHCILQKQGGEIIRRAFFHAGRKKGVPTVFFGQSLFPGRMLLHTNEMNALEDYCPVQWETVPGASQKDLDAFICGATREQRIVRYSHGFSGRYSVRRSFGILRDYLRSGEIERILTGLRHRLETDVARRISLAASHLIYAKAHTGEPYVYFPLHVPNDTQLTIRNPHFYHQEWLVEYAARCLPSGYKLWVKEHPGHVLPLRVKSALAADPRIVFKNPAINSHDLVKNAAAVMIINSTVGFEALLYFKPVVVVGDWMLKGLGITFDVHALRDLRDAISAALDHSQSVSDDEVREVLWSLWTSMWPGDVYAKEVDYDVVAQSVMRKIDSLRVIPQ